MARLFTYIFITIGLMALFQVAGISHGSLLDQLGLSYDDWQNQSTGWFLTKILIYIGMMVGGGVVIGFFGGSFSDVPITSLLAVPLAVFISSLASVTSNVSLDGSFGFVKVIIWLIFAPLIAGYIMSLYDWVRGRD
jgi:hypothetical protein